MKKLLIIMTLFTSSFFLFLGDVKAYDLAYDVDLTLLDENFYTFKNTMDEFIKNDTIYSDNYLIYKYGSYYDMYAIILPLDFTYQIKANIQSTYFQILLNTSGSLTRFVPSSNYTSVSASGTVAYNQNNVYKMNVMAFIPLYSNFDILMSKDSSLSTVTYKYNDFTTVNIADGLDKFKTLYMINEEYQAFTGAADAVHQDELEKIESFYTVIIEKISYLADEISNNYIYLSIIVIFILIFISLLIFRRFLC